MSSHIGSVEFPVTRRFSRDLPGLTLHDVALEIAQRPAIGTTEWFPTYTYTTTGAEVTTVRVIVPTIVTMPRWRGYASAGQADRREWDRFRSALDRHERGRFVLVQEHLAGIHEQLVGVRVDESRRVWREALEALRSASEAYDLDTDHGRTQGAVLDVTAASTAA
jgi:predicted secreted Zn-dependent protease